LNAMESIAIVGVGLIGGSFALALRKAGFQGRILGISSPATIQQALDEQVIDDAATLEEAAAEADVLYLAQPISGILRTLDLLAGTIGSSTFVTDAGSTKKQIVTRASEVLQLGRFLGGHPMAGKAVRGVGAADADLFRGRPYIFTPRRPDDLETPAALDFRGWIDRIGARQMVLDPEDHDRIVAFTSHLPQLASSALAATLASEPGSEIALQVCGPGVADMTRLAQSPFEIWQDILATNAPAIDRALELYIDKLQKFRQNLTNQELNSEFVVAAALAQKFRR
jgi:prephenate dehydrogenase